MKRYGGQHLPDSARIAVIGNDALGNYAVVTPLLQMLRASHPLAELHYYGGTRTKELWDEETLWQGVSFFGRPPSEVAKAVQPYDLVINVEQHPWAKVFANLCAGPSGWVVGPCLGEDGRGDFPNDDSPPGRLAEDPEWTSADLLERHPILETPFIGEIFCRMACLEGKLPPYRILSADPPGDVPDVLIATSASSANKLWVTDYWVALAERLRAQGLTVGVLGAPVSSRKQFWMGDAAEDAVVDLGLAKDLRGVYRLTEVVGAIAKAKAVCTLDNGIMHLAAATKTKTVALFRHGIHRLWLPPVDNINARIAPMEGCVSAISFDSVWEALACATNEF